MVSIQSKSLYSNLCTKYEKQKKIRVQFVKRRKKQSISCSVPLFYDFQFLKLVFVNSNILISLSAETFNFGQSKKNVFSKLFSIMLMSIKQCIYIALC